MKLHLYIDYGSVTVLFVMFLLGLGFVMRFVKRVQAVLDNSRRLEFSSRLVLHIGRHLHVDFFG